MSHITHFYHLAALDYLDASGTTAGASGPSVVMPPWTPQHLNFDSIGMVSQGTAATASLLVGHYVDALTARRQAHVAAAAIDGKHPCQNAQVPGGITTKPSTVDWTAVLTLINQVRVFINTKYIPDLLTVALLYGTPGLCNNGSIAGVWPIANQPNLFLQGYGCGNLLAWGAFPQPRAAGTQKLFDGATATVAPPTGGGYSAAGIVESAISEDILYSHYNSPTGLHPSVGQTAPYIKGTGDYTWHKAPRYKLAGTGAPSPHEVGPLARMVVNWATGNPTTVTDADLGIGNAIPGDTLGVITIGANLTYTCQTLVNTVLGYIQEAIAGLPGFAGPGSWAPTATPDPSLLMSILGRHAARALECKYLADAIGCYATNPLANAGFGATAPGCTTGIPIINNVIVDPLPNSDVYTYQVMPKSLMVGRGLTEAPRGALGHWITSEFRKVVNYQAVVPSTWNACGRDDTGVMGPIEQALNGLTVGYVGDGLGTTEDVMVNRLLRAIHPFDICIACSVHVTDTKGDTIAKFRLDPDGKVTKEPVATEA